MVTNQPIFEIPLLIELLHPVCKEIDEIVPVQKGVSTHVYKVTVKKDVFYLRIAKDPTENLDAEVSVHNQLLALGVKVPEVVYYENNNQIIRRSLC